MGGTLFSADDYKEFFELRAQLVRWIDGIFGDFDLLCTPTVGQLAP
ncbi:hypothetical protein RM533_08680 [Croceicoccus sp. F390]|uniref:Amidase domain-containing protein n=1 Tax=Croceicoccus esteveae TaxID=3075597 RepID=A0ABU2ZI38_9SPHN|nr:hypothetical protein [Croceicoccus sp. F390]MDT0576260.1 hypothetical protein [Croceicoccus sp. F390]